MQVPIGVSGVHAGAEHLALPGLDHTLEDLAALARLGVGHPDPGYREAAARHPTAANSGPQFQGALGDEAQPAPFEMRSQLEYLGHHLQGTRVPLVANATRCTGSPPAAPLADLGQQHGDRRQDVERLEPGCDQGLAVLGGDEPVRAVADDGGDVTGTEEAVQAEVGRLEDGLDGRDDRHVVAEHAEVDDRLRPAP